MVSDNRKGIKAIFDSRIIHKPSISMTEKMTPLVDYIENNHVTSRDILTIAVQIICGIQYLHECELVLGKLDIDNVFAVTLIDREVRLRPITVCLLYQKL